MRKITIHEVLRAERDMILDRRDTYLVSYPHFVRFFQDLKRITEHDVVVGTNMVYGWMPTALDWKARSFAEVAALLNRAKAGHGLSAQELKHVKGLVNNSVVGASKLLHFVNPRLYPIWDSRICRHLEGRSHAYLVNSVDRYLAYLGLCDDIVRNPRFAKPHASIESKLGYAVSALRAIELVLFYASKKAAEAPTDRTHRGLA